MAVVSMKQLLETGVHFGHQAKRWNPKMKKYIFTERNGIHIIDLHKTLKKIEQAYKVVKEIAEDGGKVLFVGTKKQAQESIRKEAERSGMFYINNRWLGGTLTNYKTISKRIDRLKEIEKLQENGTFDLLPNKEQAQLTKELTKLKKNLDGIKEMNGLPSVVFVVDTNKEEIAIAEANKLGIPVVAMVDTNVDPTLIDYVIPSNDDAIRAVGLMAKLVADAVIEAKQGKEEVTTEKVATEK